MKLGKFYSILMDSREHTIKNPFFEKKRIKFECEPSDYIEGLKFAFDRICQMGYHEPDEDDAIYESFGLFQINLKPEEVKKLGEDLKEYYKYLESKITKSDLTLLHTHNKLDSNESDQIGEMGKRDLIEKFITETVEARDQTGWRYSFKDEDNYKKFITLFTNFFLEKPIPGSEEIILRKGCKTRFAIVLGIIYKEHRATTLKNDIQYFEIIKLLNHFKNESNSNIYKEITREKEINR